MKAVDEVGSKKAAKFVLYSIVQVLYHIVISHLLYLPQTRKLFLQALGSKIETDTIVMDVEFFNWHHKGPKGLQIGKRCFLGDETLIDLYDSVTLENDVTLAQRILVLTHTNVGYQNHPLQKHFPKYAKEVIFKEGSFVGAGSIILPGTIIGEKSFIAAGSVVSGIIPDNTIFAGVPAKLIRKINP